MVSNHINIKVILDLPKYLSNVGYIYRYVDGTNLLDHNCVLFNFLLSYQIVEYHQLLHVYFFKTFILWQPILSCLYFCVATFGNKIQKREKNILMHSRTNVQTWQTAEYSRTKQIDATNKQCVNLYEKSIKLINKITIIWREFGNKRVEKHHDIEISLDITTNHMNFRKPSRK